MKIKPNQIRRMLMACPSSWEGMLDSGHTYYAKYRGGRLRVVFSHIPFNDAFIDWSNGFSVPAIDEILGNEYDGWMTTGDFVLHLNRHGLFDCSNSYLLWIKFRVIFERLYFSYERKRIARQFRKFLLKKK